MEKRSGQITTGYNSRLPQWGVTWLNQVQCFYQSLCLVYSEVLQNPPLWQAANRQAVKKVLFSKEAACRMNSFTLIRCF